MDDRAKLAISIGAVVVCVGLASFLIQTFKGKWVVDPDAPVVVAGPAPWLIKGANTITPSNTAGNQTAPEQAAQSEAYVYITGAVKKPGLFVVSSDARIYNVLELAGGFGDNANMESVNLASKVRDGMHIQVRSIGEDPISAPEGTIEESEPVNVNTANEAQLQKIPGIGPVLAKKIIERRTELGHFTSLDQVTAVDGIGFSKMERIKKYITLM